MFSSAMQLQKALRKAKDPKKARFSSYFFKTGQGQYGEGDVFLGFTVPEIRRWASQAKDLSIAEVSKLIQSQFHEERLLALIIWVNQFQAGDSTQKRQIFKTYLKSKKWVNNWDLVDASSYHIVGESLFETKRDLLYRLARSKDLWSRRIAIVSTLYFIRKNDLNDTFKLAQLLMNDSEDLMHKAVGWMLREAGKKDADLLRKFLRSNAPKMPRTMLRYSIEKFSEAERKKWLKTK